MKDTNVAEAITNKQAHQAEKSCHALAKYNKLNEE